MAKKKSVKKLPLKETNKEMSTAATWWWIIGGLILLAIVFALIDILKAKYLG